VTVDLNEKVQYVQEMKTKQKGCRLTAEIAGAIDYICRMSLQSKVSPIRLGGLPKVWVIAAYVVSQ
jgi:hypothetical protein